MESLDMLANNLANTETGGYKNDREFYSLYLAPEAAGADTPMTMPVVERQWTDFAQGVVRPTGNELDFALSGKGFFSVDGPSGPLYTRQGAFRLAGGKPVQAQSTLPLDVAPDGTLLQQGQPLGKLELVDFRDPAMLAKRGNNYYRTTDPAAVPVAAADLTVQQGKLESSNVGTAESAVRLVSVMRQFEMLHKAVSIGADMNKKGMEEVARVGP
jgi:flagellar basal body rod protein FlgG